MISVISNFILPHMLPSKKTFENKMSELGIKSHDNIIIYCREGVMSSPRVHGGCFYILVIKKYLF